MEIRPELQQFVAASDALLGCTFSQEALTEDERDLLQYYLATIAEAFPVLSQRH